MRTQRPRSQATAAAPHTFMNLPAAPEHGPLTLLLFDALNTPISSQLQARAQMLEFVKKSSGRRIAVCSSATGFVFCRVLRRTQICLCKQ